MINSNNNKRGSLVFALMWISHIEDSFAFFQKMKPQSTPLRHFATTKKSNEIQIRSENPFRDVHVDIDKAQDCASHFGEYPADEVEYLRDELHAHRVQNMVFGDCTSDTFQERYLEDELTLQLDLLKKDMPPSYLFQQDNNELMEDIREPGLQGGENVPEFTQAFLKERDSKTEVEEHKNIDLFEDLVEDGLLESLAMCAMIGLLIMAPQLI